MSKIKFGSLRAAAYALRGAENTSINEQVNFVSDALLQGRRVRRMAEEGVEIPDVVFNVLENIAYQVSQAKISALDLEDKDFPYDGIKQDLEVLQKFAEKVIEHYHADNLSVSKEVKKSILVAKDEANAIVGLSELFKRIQTVENRYRNDPQMSPIEFKEELQAVSSSLVSLEEKINHQEIAQDSQLKERLAQVKSLLENSLELSKLETHPGLTGGTALNLLLASAEKVQQAKTFEELKESAEMAAQARATIRKSSKQYQESGLFYEKLIEEVVANSVNKRIRELEENVKQPLAANPGTQEAEELAKAIEGQKEQLINYHKLAREWGGLHQEELAERIALIYEKINGQAESMHDRLLESLKHTKENPGMHTKISEVAAKLLVVSEIGKDEIKPDEIFSDSQSKNSV